VIGVASYADENAFFKQDTATISGIAANNVKGELFCSRFEITVNNSHRREDTRTGTYTLPSSLLRELRDRVHFILIDEYGMLSPQHMFELSSNLQQIKRTGNFGDTCITPLPTGSFPKNLFGPKLWSMGVIFKALKTVVTLKSCHRQAQDAEFQNILNANFIKNSALV
jgi:ATP-dependent exoDNAse (exonuclease V) alpha subunit